MQLWITCAGYQHCTRPERPGSFSTGYTPLFNCFTKTVKQGSQGVVGLHVLLDLLTRVDDRRVIASAELLTDVRAARPQ